MNNSWTFSQMWSDANAKAEKDHMKVMLKARFQDSQQDASWYRTAVNNSLNLQALAASMADQRANELALLSEGNIVVSDAVMEAESQSRKRARRPPPGLPVVGMVTSPHTPTASLSSVGVQSPQEAAGPVS